jgi:hypothetical protein
VQEGFLSEGLESHGKSSGRIGLQNSLKDCTEKLCLESLQEASQFASR